MSRSSLRRLAARSLSERDRRRAFGIAVAVLVTVATVLTVTADSTHDPSPAPTSAEIAPAAARAAPPAPAAPRARVPAREVVPARVVAHARRFLSTYLPYLYGQRSARRIVGASSALRRRLAVGRARVPNAARRRRPRVVELDSRPATATRPPDRWVVTARISDGDVAAYPIELLIVQRDGTLVVTQTGSE